MEWRRPGARGDAQAQRFVVHHGDAARTQTHARAEAQVEVVTQAETLEQSGHEHDERILVALRGVHALILEEVQHLVQHNRADELADIVNELQQGGQAKGKPERARHTLEQTRPNPKTISKPLLFSDMTIPVRGQLVINDVSTVARTMD